MSILEKYPDFDPDGAGNTTAGIFGLPFSVDDSDIVIVPVPWEVTVSYGAGTADGPKIIKEASPQLDLFDEDEGNIWDAGIAMLNLPSKLSEKSARLRKKAEGIIGYLEKGKDPLKKKKFRETYAEINKACEKMVSQVEEQCYDLLKSGKKVILLGGDHSTPLGYYKALAKIHEDFGILQVDAHMDLRNAYEGFKYSHASIMFNALMIPQISKLVQVGIRDFCKEEQDLADGNKERINYHTDRAMQRKMFEGKNWKTFVKEIIKDLPKKVHISFDIDGLDPALCPGTGTPVPGGLQYEQAMYLLEAVKTSGRTIVGCDLVEVAAGQDEINAIVGARILYRMCGLLR